MRKMKRLTSVFALLLVASLLVSNAEVLANSSDGKHYTYTCLLYTSPSPRD